MKTYTTPSARCVRVWMATTTAALAWAGGADAEIIHFTNPESGQAGHYAWGADAVSGMSAWLDITRPSDQQPDVQSGSSAGQVLESIIDLATVWHMPVTAAPIASLLRSSVSGFSAEPLSAGAPIGTSNWWHTFALHVEIEWFPNYSVNSLFPEGQRRYLGVRTDGERYGWIEVERTGIHLTAYAWAYETEPGVPISAGQIPSPGTPALLVMTSLATIRRRRP